MAPDRLRFVLSVRCIGEGHLPSTSFQTGTLGPGDDVSTDSRPDVISIGLRRDAVHEKSVFQGKLSERGHDDEVSAVLNRWLPTRFTGAELLAGLHPKLLARQAAHRTVELVRWIAAYNYTTEFPENSVVSGRVLWPSGVAAGSRRERCRPPSLSWNRFAWPPGWYGPWNTRSPHRFVVLAFAALSPTPLRRTIRCALSTSAANSFPAEGDAAWTTWLPSSDGKRAHRRSRPAGTRWSAGTRRPWL
ncbi:hypothetical protein AB0A63_39350 [Lentzea sp. NPDC042327]|uniref:hypothetical protein n=1 Tax=Lentzea sp. NPDC042327 TaxID=3154801 RepID=UPI0033ED6993